MKRGIGDRNPILFNPKITLSTYTITLGLQRSKSNFNLMHEFIVF